MGFLLFVKTWAEERAEVGLPLISPAIDMLMDYLKIQNSLQKLTISLKEDVLQLAQQISTQFGMPVKDYIESLIKIDTEHHQRHHQL